MTMTACCKQCARPLDTNADRNVGYPLIINPGRNPDWREGPWSRHPLLPFAGALPERPADVCHPFLRFVGDESLVFCSPVCLLRHLEQGGELPRCPYPADPEQWCAGCHEIVATEYTSDAAWESSFSCDNDHGDTGRATFCTIECLRSTAKQEAEEYVLRYGDVPYWKS